MALFIKIGQYLFGFITTHQEQGNDYLSSIHFARSQRDFNIAIRTFVDNLENPESDD